MKLKSMLLGASFFILLAMGACKKEEDKTTDDTPTNTGIRKVIDYTTITPTTPYKSLFLDDKGDTTVDLRVGQTRHKMFLALNYYLGAAVRDNKTLDSVVMRNMFHNTGNPFVDVPSLNIVGADLNKSAFSLSGVTNIYFAGDLEASYYNIYKLFGQLARISAHVADTAAKGKAGKLGTYLVDEQGIETMQIIQKSLIGAMQIDYICNGLLTLGLDANNKTMVGSTNYTQLEQNWDEAYGFLTLNSIYLAGSTDAAKGTTETFLGSYIWEYNKAAYAKIYPAFLKGRAAIANNDKPTLKVQADFIKAEIEKAVAAAAKGYLGKWKSGATDAARAHAIGEGLGFIYSLRFCKMNAADASFSDAVLNMLISTTEGFWDLTNSKINAASDAITAKFKL
jgi:hypothetical protein